MSQIISLVKKLLATLNTRLHTGFANSAKLLPFRKNYYNFRSIFLSLKTSVKHSIFDCDRGNCLLKQGNV